MNCLKFLYSGAPWVLMVFCVPRSLWCLCRSIMCVAINGVYFWTIHLYVCLTMCPPWIAFIFASYKTIRILFLSVQVPSSYTRLNRLLNRLQFFLRHSLVVSIRINSSLTQQVGWRKGHFTCQNIISVFSKRSLLRIFRLASLSWSVSQKILVVDIASFLRSVTDLLVADERLGNRTCN